MESSVRLRNLLGILLLFCSAAFAQNVRIAQLSDLHIGLTRAPRAADNVAIGNLTFVNNFKFIGQGPDNNFTVHENTHVTFNANGDLTAFIDNIKIDQGKGG